MSTDDALLVVKALTAGASPELSARRVKYMLLVILATLNEKYTSEVFMRVPGVVRGVE